MLSVHLRTLNGNGPVMFTVWINIALDRQTASRQEPGARHELDFMWTDWTERSKSSPSRVLDHKNHWEWLGTDLLHFGRWRL